MLDRNGVWSRVDHDRVTGIDLLHADWLHDVLQYGFRKVLEIGSHKGASLAAILQSKLAGKVAEVHIAEPNVLPELLRVTGDIPVTIHNRRGVDVLRETPDFDFVWVDGDHTVPVVREEVEQLLRHGTRTIMAHDTNSTAIGTGLCEGAHYLKQVFMGHPDYYCLEENKVRENLWTARGMFFASKSRKIWQFAKAALRGIQ